MTSTEQTKAAPVRPTAERIRQGGVVENPEARGERPKPWYTFESVHDGLLAGGLITKQAWQAGDEFKRTWYLAHGSGMAAGSVEPRVNGSSGDIGQAQANAVNRINRWAKVLAPTIFDCLKAVLGQGEPPTTWAASSGWHPATARVFICTCLEQFALTNGANR